MRRATQPDYRKHKNKLVRDYYNKFKDRLKAQARSKWAALTVDEKWEHNLVYTYGVNLAQYEEILERQNGVCAICKEPPKTVKLVVDHEHPPGVRPRGRKNGVMVRGLLCGRCNKLVGWLERNSHLIDEAIGYSKKH